MGAERGNCYKFLFYKRPDFYERGPFNFFIEVLYDDITKGELTEFLNEKMREEQGVLRTVLTVYENSEHSARRGAKEAEVARPYCSFLVFERQEEEKEYMVVTNPEDVGREPDKAVADFLYREESCQRFRIAGFIPKKTFKESLYILNVR